MDETTSGTKNRQQLLFQKTENLPVLGRSATGYSNEMAKYNKTIRSNLHDKSASIVVTSCVMSHATVFSLMASNTFTNGRNCDFCVFEDAFCQ